MKPKAKLIGENGNVFNLIGIAKKALTKSEQSAKANEMVEKVSKSSSYNEAITIISEYVEIT